MANTTEFLDHVLQTATQTEAERYLSEYRDKLNQGNDFSWFLRETLHKKKITIVKCLIRAGIPEGYGRKIMQGEKHCAKRDTIIRICAGGAFSREETDTALKQNGMNPLYAKEPRDAVLIIAFNTGKNSVDEINTILSHHGFPPLQAVGEQD